MDTKNSVEIKKQVTKEIIQTVGVPLFSGAAFFVWLYYLIRVRADKIFIFPLSGIILIILYFFSSSFSSGMMLCILTIVGLLNIVLNPSSLGRLVFFSEVIWLWGLFILLEYYKNSYTADQNLMREEDDSTNTKMALLNSGIEENQKQCDNLEQQIANYQLLGGMVHNLGSTVSEEKLVQLIADLAKKFIGKDDWVVKKGGHSDVIAKHIKTTRIPLIVNDIENDNRFYFKRSKFRSLIAVPLEVNEKFWGILKGTSMLKNAFDESDLRILSILGGIASLSLNNAKLYQQTQELAITDGLTGLYVHSYFKGRLEEEILRSCSYNLSLSVAIIDVDHFKKFNDTYGHPAGDAVLRQIANILRNSLRETDLICRYGGEEFAVIMLQTEINEAYRISEGIREGVAKERIYLPVESIQPVQVSINVSIGVAVLNDKNVDHEGLLKEADSALYRAKRKGRNRVETNVMEQ